MSRSPNDVCPLSGEPARLYCHKSSADYYITENLGLIYQKDPPTVEQMSAYAEEQYAAGVYKSYASAADLKIKTFERRIKLLKQLGARGRILDVGCACGFFIEAALKHDFDAYGIEFSKEAVAMAREDIRSRITIGDVNVLRERGDEQFDAVVAFDIIEHTQNPVKFLEEIRHVLRPQGWLMLATPDTDHFLRYVMRSRWPMLQPMQHTYLFSKKAMTYALEKSGYENIEIQPADKSLTLDYLIDQVRIHNPLISGAYGAVSRLLPRAVRHGTFAVNIGEMLACATKA
jgi:2-polyprenyl-3-methyl-5-hydroxy-6-metoxy-1,4-benzoquinol methylase